MKKKMSKKIHIHTCAYSSSLNSVSFAPVLFYIFSALSITSLPTSFDLREDSTAETLIHTVVYTGVAAGDSVSCTMTTVTNFLVKTITGTSKICFELQLNQLRYIGLEYEHIR